MYRVRMVELTNLAFISAGRVDRVDEYLTYGERL